MTDRRYSVVYRGELIEGVAFERATASLMQLVGIDTARASQLLNSARVTFKRGLDEITARRYAAALTRAGLRVSLEAEPEPAAAAEPPAPFALQAGDLQTPSTPPPPPAQPSVPAESDMPPPAALPTAPLEPIPFEFHGRGAEYFRIWIVNMILSILTLGIYSAWAKVRRKRYFYGNTRLVGAGFEYLADPKNILKGRAIVGCLLLALNAISSLLPLIGQLALTLLFIIAVPWIAIRSLAFNARNSALRNIRFSFSASYGQAAKAYLLWPLLAFLTLGILAPCAYFKQKQFVVNHSSYGLTPFTFHAGARDYYRIVLAMLLPALLGLALLAAALFYLPPAAFLIGPLLYFYLFAALSVKAGNLFFNTSQLSDHRFASSMSVRDYAALVIANTLATVCTLGLFYPWATVRTTRYRLSRLALLPAGDLERFVADAQQNVSAMGDAASDLMDFDFGL